MSDQKNSNIEPEDLRVERTSKLTDEQRQDAARLKRIYEARKAEDRSLTQEGLASACGWKTQSAVTQYLNALVPLNLDALIKFSLALDAPISEISPSLADKIMSVRVSPTGETALLSRQALEVAKAFDRLEKPSQRAAVIGQLAAFDVIGVDVGTEGL